MRYIVAADWHGNTQWAMRVVDAAVEHGISTIIQLGDFGIWPGPSGDKYVRKLSTHASLRGVNIMFVDGNHEAFPKLYKHAVGDNGLRLVAPNIWHIPRGFVWELDGLRLLGVGGAVSIDRQYRVPLKSWWPDETLTEADVERAENQGKVDILFSHDCPTSVPMVGLKNDPDSYWHRQQMNRIADATQPKLWFHGHMHMPVHYWHRTMGDFGLDIEVIGLDCDGSRHHFCVLDLARRTVDFPTDRDDVVFRQQEEPWYSRGGKYWAS